MFSLLLIALGISASNFGVDSAPSYFPITSEKATNGDDGEVIIRPRQNVPAKPTINPPLVRII